MQKYKNSVSHLLLVKKDATYHGNVYLCQPETNTIEP
jgi:hypothetical protein